jgi:competence protein ComEA
MTPPRIVPPVWSIEARKGLAFVAILAGLGLLLASRSSRTGDDEPTSPTPGFIVDPNTAPPEILLALPGLGPGLVGHLVSARGDRPFESLKDLERRVRGIGPATLSRIAPFLEIAEPQDRPSPSPTAPAIPRAATAD